MNMNSETDKRQRFKKFIVFTLMGLIFAGCMYIIFSPSFGEKTAGDPSLGFNPELPTPVAAAMADDKRDAYEQEHLRQRQQERMRSLHDFQAFLGDVDEQADEVEILPDDERAAVSGTTATLAARTTIPIPSSNSSQNRQQSSIQSSTQAYHDLNRTLGSFYDTPREDPEKERLRAEVEELRTLVMENESRGSSIDEQLELMERSYEIAARFMQQQPATQPSNVLQAPDVHNVSNASNVPSQLTPVSGAGGNSPVVPVTNVQRQVVSALRQPMSNAEFIQAYGQERNIGFYSVSGDDRQVSRNTIRARIHDDQTVSDGQETQRNVRIRITEPMSVGGAIIPANTILTGQARIGERLDVTITSIEHNGRIYATEIFVYDVDGQRGIAVPPSPEVNALREVAANTGTSMGTSITLNQSASEQIVADLGRGVIQGTSQYFARRMRVVNVHLKAGHQVFLLPNERF
jgi:conjugative transposon TraM protein